MRGEGREKALSSYRACSSQGMAGILIEEGWWRDVWNGWARFDAPAAMRNIRPNRTLQHILILSLLIFAWPGDALFTTPLPRSIERDLSLSLAFSRLTNDTGKGGNSLGWERGVTMLQIVRAKLIARKGKWENILLYSQWPSHDEMCSLHKSRKEKW